MGVILEGQSEVTDIVHAVLSLHHGSEGHGLNGLLLALALGLVHEFVERAGDGALRAVGLHLVAELHGEGSERLHLLRIGILVNTIGESLGLAALLHLAHALSHGAVGQEHELLHELVGILRPLVVAADGVSLLVDIKMQLLRVKLHRAVLEALFAQELCQPVEGAELPAVLVLELSVDGLCGLTLSVHNTVILQYLLGLLVAVAAVGADDGVGDAVGIHLGIVVELEDDTIGELVLVGAQ